MEEVGIIDGYSLLLNRKILGLGTNAFVFLKITCRHERDAAEFERIIDTIDWLLSCYILSGEEDYLSRVVATDPDALANFSRNGRRQIE